MLPVPRIKHRISVEYTDEKIVFRGVSEEVFLLHASMTAMQISDTSRQTFLRHKRLNGSSYKQCGHPFGCKHQEIEDDIHVHRKL